MKKKTKAKAKKTRTEAEYQELRKSTVALANCAVFVLATRGKLGVGTGMVWEPKTKTARHWTVQFFDALDSVGLSYDRDAWMKGSKKR